MVVQKGVEMFVHNNIATLSSNLAIARRGIATTRQLNRYFDPHERAHPIPGKSPVVTDIKDALNLVKSGDNIFVHGIGATPTPLLNGLVDHVKAKNLSKITLHHLHLEGEARWIEPDVKDKIRSNSLFTGHNLRASINDGTADFNSIFLQEIPLLFRKGVIKLNGTLIHVSPPDAHGFCSLGTSVDGTRAAINCSDYVIALSNKNMPRTFGDGLIHQSQVDVLVRDDSFPIHERKIPALGAAEIKIGELIAEHLVSNGSTLQMGIGGIPDAALHALKAHKDLGVHTEMLSDGILPLIDCGAVTNAKKFHHPGRITVSFAYGTKKLYNYLNDNPFIHFGDVQWVNDPAIIKQNPKVIAINSAVEVDLTGQIVADSIGKRFLSGFGGQVDFMRGAALSEGGYPIIALASAHKKSGKTKIVPFIQEGSGIVTSRAHAHYVVTEYGIAQLWGRNVRQRAYELIKISHPDHRESLEKAAFERLKVMPSAD